MSQQKKNVAALRPLRPGHDAGVEAAPANTRAVRRVLLALRADECPRSTLWRAHSLSVVLDGELHVVRIVPPLQRGGAFSRVDREDALGALKGMLEARRATRSWLTTALGRPLPKGRLKLRGGKFFEQVAKRATELDAALIVVAPPTECAGTHITRLARTTRAPVLIAREATGHDAVVAATDLSDGGVLQSAAALCRRLDAPLVAVHNLAPVSLPVGPEAFVQVALPPQRDVEQLRRRALVQVAQTLHADVEAVLTTGPDAAEAVLKEARRRDADIIVVGTSRRSWFDRLTRRDTSAQIVIQAKRSVLVTPLGCDGSGGRARSRKRSRGFRRVEGRRVRIADAGGRASASRRVRTALERPSA